MLGARIARTAGVWSRSPSRQRRTPALLSDAVQTAARTITGVETFVVRVWKPAGDEPASAGSELRGIVERPGGLLVQPFHSAQELVDALRAAVADLSARQGGAH